MDMDISELDGNVTCIRLTGRLDSPGVDRIETRFTAALASLGRPAVVDLSKVSFLASMGIRMFISSARALHLKGAQVALFGASEMVQSVLEHVALDQIIPLAATEAEALAKLRS
ncbi:MAG: anti-anti-sigma factor [Burkholderiales bacterium PBB1]|nr:MAG: anti-anti-sigma factor [Burkholderiales bacterium PBB1]